LGLAPNGCLASDGQLLDFTGVPSGNYINNLEVFYIQNVAAEAPGCDSYAYFSYTDGGWKFDFGGQDTPACGTLHKYDLPVAIVAAESGDNSATCVTGSGTDAKTIPYTN